MLSSQRVRIYYFLSFFNLLDMVKFYEELCAQFGWEQDKNWVEKANLANCAEISKLDAKIAEAVEKFGETEVREANLAKAEFLCSIGDRVRFLIIIFLFV